MREMTFKMERPGLVKEGDSVHVSEKKTALNYSYIIEPAVAMSGCFKVNERIEDRDGIVKEILAGNSAVEIYSSFYQNSYGLVAE